MRLRWLVNGILASLIGGTVAATDLRAEEESALTEERPSAAWRTVAERAAAFPPVLSDADEASFGAWALEVSVALGPRAGEPIGSLLCTLPALDRTRLIAAWATSPHDALRLGLAHALAYPLWAVGLPSAIELLAEDGDPDVRAAARAAALLRGGGATA
jgi:hypothetical protein